MRLSLCIAPREDSHQCGHPHRTCCNVFCVPSVAGLPKFSSPLFFTDLAIGDIF